MTDPYDYRGDGVIAVIVILVVIGLAIFGAYALIRDNEGSEVEGYVKYDDCRQIIPIAPPSVGESSRGKQFVCSTMKTNSGKLMSSMCAAVETTPDGKCQKAYTYQRGPVVRCSKDYPYLAQDDQCYSGWVSGSVLAFK